MRFLSKASMMMVVERRMDQPAALGWRARDVRRLWSGCGLWDGFVAVVAAAVASAWMGLMVACIEVWKNGVFVSMGCERRCRFPDFSFYFIPSAPVFHAAWQQSSHLQPPKQPLSMQLMPLEVWSLMCIERVS